MCYALQMGLPPFKTQNLRVFGDIPISINEFAQRMNGDFRKKLENILVNYMAKTQVSGVSLTLARGGQVLYTNGFDWANV